MRVVGIVQARTGATRLPRKVLLDICGAPMLARVIERARRVTGLDEVWVATSTLPDDDAVADLATSLGVQVSRGSLDDVLARYAAAAEAAAADVVVRLTGDSPCLEPEYVRRALMLHQSTAADLTCAKDPHEIVPGTGCEVITLAALRMAAREGRLPEDREHVTWYLLANPQRFSVKFLQARPGWKNPGIRLTVDEPADLELVRDVFARLAPRDPGFGLAAIMDLFAREPELFNRNRNVLGRPNLYANQQEAG